MPRFYSWLGSQSPLSTGEGKTDAKDAYIIAETARVRTDLSIVDVGTDLVLPLGLRG